MHPSDLRQHRHADHSCSPPHAMVRSSVFAWVSFRRALPSKLGQFCASINRRSHFKFI
uniref:Uncharacterized protein n=1 Tax=uncultured bacterium A1Q1_fos_600 TaxID=1256587 RepID=L7VUK7_9BACT|nr:hypothetical protein [uncultured bacterium A1Q1_fos_600]